ncbi:hypothetical protein [Sandaracinus amylolyticus]|uniref:hypothetical protein n=1 Tax=Sandaracinus amylolyticus TaxID=927083 RepID=UPI001F461417|nr:hypothetical protein [Sandaracinus amylolyticus]
MQYRALVLALASSLAACAEPEPPVCGGAIVEPLTLAAGGRAEIVIPPRSRRSRSPPASRHGATAIA